MPPQLSYAPFVSGSKHKHCHGFYTRQLIIRDNECVHGPNHISTDQLTAKEAENLGCTWC